MWTRPGGRRARVMVKTKHLWCVLGEKESSSGKNALLDNELLLSLQGCYNKENL